MVFGMVHETQVFYFEMKDIKDASYIIRFEIFRNRSQSLLGV